MASSTATATQTRAGNTRGRGGNRGKRGGGRGGQQRNGTTARDLNHVSKPNAPAQADAEQDNKQTVEAFSKDVKQDATADDAATADDGAVCWICAESVKYWSVSECNHRTCHVCALRLRALYKKMECTFCKVRYPDRPCMAYLLIRAYTGRFAGTPTLRDLHNLARRAMGIIHPG